MSVDFVLLRYLKMLFRISLVTLRVAVLAAVLAAEPRMEPEEEVRVHGGEGFREALFYASPEAIDIPGYKAQVHRPPFRQFFRLCPYHNKKRNRLQPLFQKCYNFPANTSGDGVEQMDRMLWRHINESGNHIFCIKLESCKAQHEV